MSPEENKALGRRMVDAINAVVSVRVPRFAAGVSAVALVLGLMSTVQVVKAQEALPNLYMQPLEFQGITRDPGGNCVGTLKATIQNKSTVKIDKKFNNVVKLPGEVKYVNASGLPAGASGVRTFPATVASGTAFTFQAKTDSDEEITESSELDNSRTLTYVCISLN